MRLDELLDELQARVDAAQSTRDRVHGLFEAVLSVGRELELDQALRRVVEAGAALVDARYAALGVIGSDGRTLSRFLTVGVSEEEAAALGPAPSGHGLLGELIRHPEPLRLAELSDHPAAQGLPPGHPPMRTFLGVPVRVRDEVFGNLYLAEKRGGGEFDTEDEVVLATLAVAAGVAIDNARLYEEARQRQRWLQAGAEVTGSLLSGSPQAQVLGLIAERAREITGAAVADVAVPLPHGDELVVELAVGDGAADREGLVLPCAGTLTGAAYSGGVPVSSPDVRCDPRITVGPLRGSGLGPAVAVPMGAAAGQARGVLMLARLPGEPPFGQEEIRPLLGFAGQAGLALELADHRRDAEQLAILEDRDRIARDLHDLAIQRLFATGMTLQSAGRFIDHPEAADRVRRAVDDLDDTVKIIRSAIFGLRARERGSGRSLRSRAARLVDEAAAVLGFAPRLRMEGLLDTGVAAAVADQVAAALGEALANAARHARARRVDVLLEATGDRVALTVEDDGVGIPEGGRRSGLRNLAERAEQLGGALLLESPPGGGTRLTWCAPLSDRAA
ncbi:GAF domain-containing protein [Peterkaempfera bronchialis]|uniref:GAF domain-containing protein n=2 Tax=Peterkaempfera bronchialis TaxID=2126346 RepID=A0A345T689_9ACTN|nr:GAF domain-containing protein [Peterkaempfera bronchialis]